VFTARYALSPYIKQIRFVFKGLTGTVDLGGKQPGRAVNHAPPSSTEVKNEWSCISAPSICLHGVGKQNFFHLLTYTASSGTGLH
jgi:hypothetical protein